MTEESEEDRLRRIIREELHAISELEVMTTAQVAALLGIHQRTVLKFVDKKGLPASILPGTREFRFLRKQVLEWAFSNGKPSAA